MSMLLTNQSTNTSFPDSLSMYDEVMTISAFTLAVLLVPLNAVLIFTLCRNQQRKRPINWLIITVAISDSLFLVTRSFFFLEQYILPNQTPKCKGVDLFLRIVDKSGENVSAITTATIAILRAFAAWRSEKYQLVELDKWWAIILIAFAWSLGTIAPSVQVKLTCGKTKHCQNGLGAAYGPMEIIHSSFHLICVNLTVIICYTYICIVLYRTTCESPLDKSTNKVTPTYARLCFFIIAYVVLYTIFTAPSHINSILHTGCLTGTVDTDQKTIQFGNVFDVIIPIGVCGFNPVMLYTLNEALRQSALGVVNRFWLYPPHE